MSRGRQTLLKTECFARDAEPVVAVSLYLILVSKITSQENTPAPEKHLLTERKVRAEPLDDRQTEGDGIIATEELYRRPARPPNYEAECRALTMLARHLTLDPHGVLQKLTELIVDLCQADAAGACVLDTFDGNNQFHWHASAGRFGEELLKVVPGDTNPCAKVISSSEVLLDRKSVV